jgi:aspartate racemase
MMRKAEIAMQVGLIGGIGPAATEFYYRGLIDRHTQAGTVLDVTIAHADAREMTQNLARRDAFKQAAIFARLIKRLKAAGAQAVAITSMGGHFCIRETEAVSLLPIINAIPAVNLAVRRLNLARIGLVGTRTVMESGLYGGITGAQIILPPGDALEQVHQNYIEMAIAGRATPAQREWFFSIGRKLCVEQGAEAIVLGGTDLFLAFDGYDTGFPVVDCASIHIDAIYRISTQDVGDHSSQQ